MKVLLFGATGQVGKECHTQILKNHPNWELITPTRQEADFLSLETIHKIIVETAPKLVINACAYTAVDQAESNEQTAQTVNGDSLGAIGKACSELRIPTIHISTDYVFDGNSQSPYSETSPTNPMGVYGTTKLSGEQQLITANPKHIILRTSWVFSPHGNNFVKTMIRLGKERDELSIVSDQIGCPTAASDIASSILEITDLLHSTNDEAPKYGVYNCSNAGICSWFQFAQSIFNLAERYELIKKQPRLNPITTDQYPTPAQRPAYSVLDCHKLENLLGHPMRHWNAPLEELFSSQND